MMKRIALVLALAAICEVHAQPRAVRHPGPVSPELDVAAPQYGASQIAVGPRLAIGPDHSLVIWTGGNDLARIARDASAIDVPSIEVPHPNETIRSSDAVWIGNHFVVARVNCVNCSVPPNGPSHYSLSTSVLQSNGTLAEASRVPLASGEIAAATNGASMLILAGGELFLVDDRGVIRKRTPVDDYALSPAIASDGNGFLVAWTSLSSTIKAMHVGADGASSERAFVVADGKQPALARDARGYALAFTRDEAIHLVQFFDDGSVGADAIVRSTRYGATVPTLAWNGSELRMAWKEAASDFTRECFGFGGGDVGYDSPCAPVDLFGARVDARGSLSDVQMLRASISFYGPNFPSDEMHLAADGRDFVLAWSEPPLIDDDYGHAVYAMKWSESGERGAPRLVSQTLQSQEHGLTAQNGSGSLMTWIETDGALRIARVDASDKRVGGASTIARGATSAGAAWSGAETFIAWSEDSRVLLSRIDTNGQLLDQLVLASGSRVRNVSVACKSTDCLIVWQSNDGLGETYARRIGTTTALFDHFSFDLGPSLSTPKLATDGSSYFVTESSTSAMFCRVIGDHGDAALLPITTFATLHYFGQENSIGCSANGCLVAAGDFTKFIPGDDALVPLTLGTVHSVVWNGRHFIAATARNCVTTATIFNERGIVIESGIPLTDSCVATASLFVQGDGRVIVTYARQGLLRYRLFTDAH